ncbi:MAG: hypothetical protein RO257_04440 [Candidatus Kapabacteria bacterium]|nr:hypothetical protein [Candidatus Kapabacteria bacterium]
MLKNKLNIAIFQTLSGNFSERGILIILFVLIPAILFISSCDTCTGIDKPGINPEDEVFFTASPTNSDLPNIYRTNFQGSAIENIILNGMAFSSPSINGKIAFIRKSPIDGKNNLYVSKLDGSDAKLITSDNDIFNVSYPILSPDGKYVAFNGGNSSLIYYDNSASTSMFNQMTGRLTLGCQPRFSNDSKYLAFFEGDGTSIPVTLKVIDAKSADEVKVIYSKILGNVKFSDNNEIAVNWSANSKSLIYSIQKGINDDIHIINIENSSERIISVPNSEIGGRQPAISPKEDFLAVAGNDGNIWLIFIATNDLRFSNITKSEGFERNYQPKWSSEGTKILYSSSSQFDTEFYSTLVCSELQFEVALARAVKTYIISSNVFKGFWNYRTDNL